MDYNSLMSKYGATPVGGMKVTPPNSNLDMSSVMSKYGATPLVQPPAPYEPFRLPGQKLAEDFATGLGQTVVGFGAGMARMGKSVANTLGSVVGIHESVDSEPAIQKMEEMATPQNTTQAIGKLTGDIATFFLPAGEIVKVEQSAAKAIKGLGFVEKYGPKAGAKIESALTFASRSALQGLSTGEISLAQTGDLKSGLEGAIFGAVAEPALKGVKALGGKGYEAMKGVFGKTSEGVLATAEKDVGKLSAGEQKLWYKNKAQVASQESSSALQKAKEAADKDIIQAKEKINAFQQNLGQVTKEKSMSLKKPAQQLMKDTSNKYVELTGEAANSSPALSKKISADSLSIEIDSKFEHNPDIAASLKNELGLIEKVSKPEIDPATKLPIIKSEAPPVKTLTNQEVLNKARDIMQSVSKTAKSGGRAYTPEEYQAIQKYSFLMEQLGKNGVDMKEANQLWKEWVPVRNQILKQIRPFEEEGKTPFTSTLLSAESKATTAKQMVTKIDSQKFISELESRLNLPKGSLGKETRTIVKGLENANLSKQTLENTYSKIISDIKADKIESLKTMTIKQYDSLRQAKIRSFIKKALIGLGIYTVAKATGADKTILNMAGSVL